MGGNWLYKLLLAISAITVASGLAQLIRPDLILGIIGGEATAGARHSFGIIGLFMVLFGGMLLHALLTAGDHSVVVLWAGLQKLGAAGAVGLGVSRALFGPLALTVAGFDLISGILILLYLSRTSRARAGKGPLAAADVRSQRIAVSRRR